MELRMFALIFLLPAVFGVKEQYVPTRCQCITTQNFMAPKQFQKIEVIPQSSSCDQLEIIVTVHSVRKCLDPNAKEGKFLISCWKRNEGNTKKVKNCVRRKLLQETEKKKKNKRTKTVVNKKNPHI
ncbi:C-X-C motif chemokine 11-1-like isoform 2-T2 [Mantella aurantiaca]